MFSIEKFCSRNKLNPEFFLLIANLINKTCFLKKKKKWFENLKFVGCVKCRNSKSSEIIDGCRDKNCDENIKIADDSTNFGWKKSGGAKNFQSVGDRKSCETQNDGKQKNVRRIFALQTFNESIYVFAFYLKKKVSHFDKISFISNTKQKNRFYLNLNLNLNLNGKYFTFCSYSVNCFCMASVKSHVTHAGTFDQCRCLKDFVQENKPENKVLNYSTLSNNHIQTITLVCIPHLKSLDFTLKSVESG